MRLMEVADAGLSLAKAIKRNRRHDTLMSAGEFGGLLDMNKDEYEALQRFLQVYDANVKRLMLG
jgi:hypothetical protein